MKNLSLQLVLTLLATVAVIYSCTKDQIETTPVQIEEAQLIKYQDSEVIPGQYIVVYQEGVMPLSGRADNSYEADKAAVRTETEKMLAANGIDAKPIFTYAKAIHGFSIQLSEDDLMKLRRVEGIAYIEQDQTVSVTMGGPPGGGGGSSPQVTPWGITRVNGGVSGAGKVAYIIDSGIEAAHADLNVDMTNGFNAFSSGPDADLSVDGNGHGTHVAGTVAAVDNEIGVIGVAAGATVVPVKVLNKRGSGSNSGVIAGVDHVAAQSDCDAANMSLGGGFSQALNDAVISASSNCPFALAAGNESTDAGTKSPASANGNNIYTVSSMAQGDNWSSFSNYGNPPVDYCAPGSSVYSTYKGGGYATLSGTSMASPHVCGILLLGNITASGTVNGDPDGNPDTIASN